MKTSLEHLPEAKRERIAAIAVHLQAAAPVEMVILFGSHARGDWVEDPETGYRSDFDLLVIVATEELARDEALWARLAAECRALAGPTSVTLIAHDIKEVRIEACRDLGVLQRWVTRAVGVGEAAELFLPEPGASPSC